jgi:hypothetical protein
MNEGGKFSAGNEKCDLVTKNKKSLHAGIFTGNVSQFFSAAKRGGISAMLA